MPIRTRKPRAKADRNPSRSPEFSVRDFFNRFPDDDTCTAHVMNVRYGLRHVAPSADKMRLSIVLPTARPIHARAAAITSIPAPVRSSRIAARRCSFGSTPSFYSSRRATVLAEKNCNARLVSPTKPRGAWANKSARLCPKLMASKSCKDTSNLTKPMSVAVAQANAAAVLLARPSCLA